MMNGPAQNQGQRRVLMTADAVGGVWTYAMELTRGLSANGYAVVLAVLGPKPNAAQLRECAALENCELLNGGRALEWMDDPWKDVDASGEWLQEVAEEYNPDLVHLNDYSHATLPWRCPVVLAAHSCVATWWRSVKNEAVPARYAEYRRRVRSAMIAASVVVTPTAAFCKQLAQEYGLALSQEIIPNGRSSNCFSALPKEPSIISAGRLWDEGKNVQILERIAEEVEWPISVAGDGGFAGVERLGERRVISLGRLHCKELSEALGRASIYAAPAKYEPFGLAILEAALSECALVLSDLATLRETWDGCAVFVPADDESAWISALNALAEDEPRLRIFQGQARSRAMAFTPERQAASYAALYNSLIETPREASELLFA